MGSMKDAGRPADDAADGSKKGGVQLEIDVEGRPEPVVLEVSEGDILPDVVLTALKLEDDFELFERDKDAPLSGPIAGRKAMRLVASRSKQVTVQIRYEHRQIEDTFPPSKTVFKVLQWAIGAKGFKLDESAAPRANLILPGAESPLPREDVVGKHVTPGEKILVLDLTLRDFTNG